MSTHGSVCMQSAHLIQEGNSLWQRCCQQSDISIFIVAAVVCLCIWQSLCIMSICFCMFVATTWYYLFIFICTSVRRTLKGNPPNAAVWLEIALYIISDILLYRDFKGTFWCVFPVQYLTDTQNIVCSRVTHVMIQYYSGSGLRC